MTRIRAVLAKELADLRKNPALFAPALLTGFISILLPFFVAILVPYFADERLSDSSDFEVALELYKDQPSMRALDPEGAIQAWIFQQFLILLVLTPVAGSMSLAAYSVIGEKAARTLEPLLATPITTFELLSAKVLGALLPALGTHGWLLRDLRGRRGAARPGGRIHGAPDTAVAGGRLPARPAGNACSTAAGGVRIVARQRRPQRPADWRLGHPADRRAPHRAADG